MSNIRIFTQLPRVAVRTYANARSMPNYRAMSSFSRRPAGVPLPQGMMMTGPSLQKRTMFIQTEDTPNEDSLKFLPGSPILQSAGTHEFLTPSSALPSPLATSLFNVSGVRSVFYGPDFVTVSKESDYSWSLLKPEIFSVIMEHFTSGKPLFEEGKEQGGSSDTVILDTDSETVAMVKELLDTRVRPTIQEDGGDIEYMGFDENSGLVQLSLKGSCRGCDSSTVTLKNGIERMLMHYIPEVKAVEQVTAEEEKVAVDEFAKFEARLRSEGRSVEV